MNSETANGDALSLSLSLPESRCLEVGANTNSLHLENSERLQVPEQKAGHPSQYLPVLVCEPQPGFVFAPPHCILSTFHERRAPCLRLLRDTSGNNAKVCRRRLKSRLERNFIVD